MSEEKSKLEFVEKMKQENPRAFNFLASGASNLLASIKDDLLEEIIDWQDKAIRVFGKEQTKIILNRMIKELEEE